MLTRLKIVCKVTLMPWRVRIAGNGDWMTRSSLLCGCVAFFVFSPRTARAQAHDSSPVAAKTAVLRGIVKDEYGDPLAEAEIRVQPGSRFARTDTSGKFRIEAAAGRYNVLFRRLGYAAEDFSWRARPGEGTELSVRLDPLPRALDTIVVRDSHDRVAGASSIAGVVVDSALQPLRDVEIQLIGTGRHAVSYETGEFFFAGLAEGYYVIRARRMGFTPANLTVKLGKGGEHDTAIRLTALPHTLATVEVRERSGFGRSATAWEQFDRRQRWKGSLSATIGRDELGRKGKMPLDWALRGTSAWSIIGTPSWSGGRAVQTSILGGGRSRGGSGIPGDVCVLVNGVKGERLPLSWFGANEVERVEVYAANSDWSLTIGARMLGVRGCEPDGINHPPYYVVWLRGGS